MASASTDKYTNKTLFINTQKICYDNIKWCPEDDAVTIVIIHIKMIMHRIFLVDSQELRQLEDGISLNIDCPWQHFFTSRRCD